MKNALIGLMLLFSAHLQAQQVLQNAKLSSCNDLACSRLVSLEIHRSTLSPNIMAFGDATLDIFNASNPNKAAQSFKAGDGYYDLAEQIIVLRGLRGSKFKELIFNLTTNVIQYF